MKLAVDHQYYRSQQNPRVLLLFFIAAALFIGLWGRLIYLQIIAGEQLETRASKNSTYEKITPAPRGLILDRKGNTIARNTTVYTLWFNPFGLHQTTIFNTRQHLMKILDLSSNSLIEKMQYPGLLYTNLSSLQLALLYENMDSLKGVEIRPQLQREYPYPEAFSHLIGYVGPMSQEEIQHPDFKDYPRGSMIGKTGLEQYFESDLKGKVGVQKKRRGTHNSTQRETPAQPGKALHLTLDAPLQEFSYQTLKQANKTGAIVVMNLKGEVLALTSYPSFDLNKMTRGLSTEEWRKLQNNPQHPFLNRPLRAYAPGSIFKMVTTLAALETGTSNPYREFISKGSLNVNGHIFHDWNRDGFGRVDLRKALAHSIDTVFYELSLEMGIAPIAQWARKFQLGNKTTLNLPGEQNGIIPNPAWKKKYFKQEWLPGDSVNASIGQGFVQLTPIQAAHMTRTIASKGEIIPPKLFKSDAAPSQHPSPQSRLSVKPEHWSVIFQGMQGATEYGTAKAMRPKNIPTAGKTGTAETGRKNKNHAWVVGFAPVHNPQYVITVFLEHGGSGGKDAAPLAGKILDYLFHVQAKI